MAQVHALELLHTHAQARALLWQAGEMSLHEAVDWLQAFVVSSGLVDQIGQDEVQNIMAEAFMAVRDDYGPELEITPTPEQRSQLATSTREVIDYLLREGNPARLRAFIATHSDRNAILQYLGEKH